MPVKFIKVGDKILYSVNDSIPDVSESELSGIDVTYLENGGVREAYSNRDAIESIMIERAKNRPKSGFDQLLSGILNVPKE